MILTGGASGEVPASTAAQTLKPESKSGQSVSVVPPRNSTGAVVTSHRKGAASAMSIDYTTIYHDPATAKSSVGGVGTAGAGNKTKPKSKASSFAGSEGMVSLRTLAAAKKAAEAQSIQEEKETSTTTQSKTPRASTTTTTAAVISPTHAAKASVSSVKSPKSKTGATSPKPKHSKQLMGGGGGGGGAVSESETKSYGRYLRTIRCK